MRLGCGSGGEEEEAEDACEGGGFGGACLMGAAGAESHEEVGEGSWRESRKRSMKLRVDLLCVDEIETVQVGQDVCCLLE